jgi:hypothetical protein
VGFLVGGGEQGGEMTQTMYAHVNKRTTTKKLKLMCEKKNEEGL